MAHRSENLRQFVNGARTPSHMSSRIDKPKDVTAAAHKLACLVNLMITRGEAYVDQGPAVLRGATWRTSHPWARPRRPPNSACNSRLPPHPPEHPNTNQSLRVCFLKGLTGRKSSDQIHFQSFSQLSRLRFV